jgi:hypothetical protein
MKKGHDVTTDPVALVLSCPSVNKACEYFQQQGDPGWIYSYNHGTCYVVVMR